MTNNPTTGNGGAGVAADAGDGATDATRPDRDSMFLRGVLTHPRHMEPLIVTIRNLSAGGLMAEAIGQFAPGDRIAVDISGLGSLNGSIAWARDGRIGLSFDTPIDPHQARRPIARRR